MKLPSAEEYLQIIDKKSPGTLATLFDHKFILAPGSQNYFCHTSRNHIIFKTEHFSKFYAVRFFLHDDDELFRRYHQLEDYLTSKDLSWKVPFRFMDEEYYPAVLMDWIDALSFTDYLDLIINNPTLIEKLQKKLLSVSRDLEKNSIGHGNLNMKHIRFVKEGPDYTLKLIDYDSMFIPAFKEKDSFSVGTSGFQHSMRLASDFSEKIDRFSIWVFITALEAFKIDPLLWKNSKENGFDKQTQILFTYRDIAYSKQSVTFQKLRRYNNPSLNFYCDKLVEFCNATSLDAIEPPRLYEETETAIPSPHIMQVPIAQPQQPVKESVIQQPAATHEDTVIQKTAIPVREKVVPVEKTTAKPKEISTNKNVDAKPKIILKEKAPTPVIEERKEKKKPVAAFIIIAVLLLSALGYIAWNNQTKKAETAVATVQKQTSSTPQPASKQEEPKPPPASKQKEPTTKETVFTPANITQFLFQLYQSYNKRDLSSILSNYTDNTVQYYDAGSITKDKLSDVIRNLFIKPKYYECHPDITSLQINPEGAHCKLTISINETIKADNRSKTENYSSKLEYTVDTAFKIIAEKNIE